MGKPLLVGLAALGPSYNTRIHSRTRCAASGVKSRPTHLPKKMAKLGFY